MKNNISLLLPFLFIQFSLVNIGYSQRLQNPPPLEREQRVKIAKKVLAEVYAEPDPTNPQLRQTAYQVLLDPVGTAEYILANPAPNDGIGWDHAALVHLMTRHQILSDDQIVSLLDGQKSDWLWFQCVGALSRNGLRDRQVLLNRLISEVQTRTIEQTEPSLSSVLHRIQLAKHLEMPELVAKLENDLQDYFSSGNAGREYAAIEEQNSNPDYVAMTRFVFRANAPADIKKDFSDGALPASLLGFLFMQEQLSDAEILAELRRSIAAGFGQNSIDYMRAASLFAEIGQRDLNLAEQSLTKLRESARCWARISLAVGIVDTQPDLAKKHLRLAYQELEQHPPLSDHHEQAYNFPLALIGATGLRAVEIVEPEFMETAVNIVVGMTPALLGSRINSAKSNYFTVTTAVARYDQEAAIRLLRQAEDDVDLHSAASYFAALTALEPQRILNEYQEIPQQSDSRGTTWRPHIRNAIIPALSASSDDLFWNALSPSLLRLYESPKNRVR